MDMPIPSLGSPKGEAMTAMLDEMENPASEMSGTSAPELLIPRSLFPKGAKEGEIYSVIGTIGKVGSKVSFTPTEAFKPGAESEEMESGEV